MSGETLRAEIILYGFMVLNVLAVATGLAWAWRRGLLSDLDATMRTALGLPPDTAPRKEIHNG